MSRNKRRQVLSDDIKPTIGGDEPVEPFEATKSRMPPKTQERVQQTIVNIDKLLELKKQKE